MMANAVPDWMRGLWRRLSIETGEGQRDCETQVFYLQTSTCFGDLRIPGDRPDLRQASFSSLTQAEALALSQQQGFAGIIQFEQGHPHCCQWVRQIDYQPVQPVRDVGLLYWKDDILIEEGVEQVYREEWQKVDDGNGDYTALVLIDRTSPSNLTTWKASLVIAGGYFVYSCNRSFPLPSDCSLHNYSLANCLTRSISLEKQQDYLDCEIAFGRCRSGRVPWEIQRSTIPWREGSPLWFVNDLTIDLDNQRVMQIIHQSSSPEARQEIREWEIWEWGTGQAFQAERMV